MMEPHKNSRKRSTAAAAASSSLSFTSNDVDHSDVNLVDWTSNEDNIFAMGPMSTQSLKRKYPPSVSSMGQPNHHRQQQQNQPSDSTLPVKVEELSNTLHDQQHRQTKKQNSGQKESLEISVKSQREIDGQIMHVTNIESEEYKEVEQFEAKIAKTKLPKNNKYFCPKCFQLNFKWSKLSSHFRTEHNTELKGFPGTDHNLHMIHYTPRQTKRKRKRMLQTNEQSHNDHREGKLKPAPPIVDEVKLPEANNVISHQGFSNGNSFPTLANIGENGIIDPPIPEDANSIPSFGNPPTDFSVSNNEENIHSLCRTKNDTSIISESATFSSKGKSSNSIDGISALDQNSLKRDHLAEQIREKATCSQRKAKPIISILRKKLRFGNKESDSAGSTKDEFETKNGISQQASSASVISTRNLLQSISKMVSKVHFAPDSDLAQIRMYEVTQADKDSYGSSMPVPPEEKKKSNDPNLHSDRNVEINFDRTVQTAAQESAEESDKSTYRYANKLTELALHGSINDMISCLRGGASARGTSDEKPIDKVKKQLEKLHNNFTNLSISVASLSSSSLACNQKKERTIFIRQRIKQFEVKKTILKIFKEIEIIVELGRLMHPKLNPIQRMDDRFKDRRNECARKIKDVSDWIHRFHKDTPRMNIDVAINLVNVNISYDGMTMLHSAVCIYAVDAIKKLRRLGAKNNIKCNKLGTAVDVAKSLRDEAATRGDKKFESAFSNILLDLD